MAHARLPADPSARCTSCTGSTAAPRARGDARPDRLPRLAAGSGRQRAPPTQLQLDVYGELLQTACAVRAARRTARPRHRPPAGARPPTSSASSGSEPDAGIWEVRSEPAHFTQSKMMCWVALDRACELARAAADPRQHAARWRREAARSATFVETRCCRPRANSYVRFAGGDELDASLLLARV